MDDLTAFQRDILYVIASLGEPYGLAIRDALADYYGTDVNHGRLYPNLDDLAEHGYLEKRRHDERKNTYSLTDKGRDLIVKRHEWEADCILQRSGRPVEPTA
jgi:PadR family transcriptional regulator PadR